MRLFTISIALACLLGCTASSETEYIPHDNWPDKRTLMRNFRDQDTIIMVYGKENYKLSDMIVNGVAIMQQMTERVKIVTRRDDEITEQEVTNYPLFVLGTRENLLIRRLSETVPVTFTDNGFQFNGKDYAGPNDLIKLSFFPNPYAPELPLTIIYGNHEEVIMQYVEQELNNEWGFFFWDNWGYQIYHNGNRSIVGNFSEADGKKWTIDNSLMWNFDYEGATKAKSEHITYITHDKVPKTDLDAYAKGLETDIAAISAFTGKPAIDNIVLHIYPTLEIKTMQLNDADQSTIDYTDKSVHTVIDGPCAGYRDEKVNMLVLREMLGHPKSECLEEGLAVLHTSNWMQDDVHRLAANLLAADALPSVALLTNNTAFEGESDYLMHIASASFVQYLIDKLGKEQFLQVYSSWSPDADTKTITKEWYASIEKNAPLSKARVKPALPAYLKGFNFAHEGYQVYNGYMGTEAEKSIHKLKEIGCNTISIIPYSGFTTMTKPERFYYTSGAGAENDMAVIHAAYTAKQDGMVTMMKPQLWSWLGWTGDIKMQSESDWKQFFENYEEWIMHYALIAELYHFDVLCVGNEFQAASLSKHAQWDAIFDKVRMVYSGNITYAANWGAEFEQVSFWDKLDLVSVNCYYPIADHPDPSDAELLSGFEHNLDVIEGISKKYGQQVLFTEIGFKSIAQPWLNPHKDADEFDFSEEAQKRCYTTMQQAMADEDWIKGVYLWKWPSYMQYAGENNKDFTPCGKQAEAVIQKWFSEK